MKKCFKCGLEKDLKSFYTHPRMGDGHLNKCIKCAKNDSNIRYQEKSQDPGFIENERRRGRKKYHKYKYKSNGDRAQTMSDYYSRYPEKYKAKCAMKKVHKVTGMQAHHWSYNEEHFTDVIHMSTHDHMKAHRFLIYDQERRMYRTTTGILLDTSDRHLKYIQRMVHNKPD